MFILDWDVHHGNGTNRIFYDSPEVLFASIHQWPFYPGTGRLDEVGTGAGEGFSLNLPVPGGSGEDVFLSLLEHVAEPAARQFAPDLILLSAGFDAHRADPVGGCNLHTSSYGEFGRRARALADELQVSGRRRPGGRLRPRGAGRIRARAHGGAGAGRAPRAVERHALAEAAGEVLGRYWEL